MMQLKTRLFIGICLWILGTSLVMGSGTASSPPPTARSFLESEFNYFLDVLSQSNVSQDIKNQKITDRVIKIFDFDLIAKLSIGKAHWPKLTKTEKQDFTQAFQDHLLAVYLNQSVLFTDEKLEFGDSITKGKKVLVNATIRSKDSTTKLKFKTYNRKNKWQIYDVEIEGVSVVQSFKAQFAPLLETQTIQEVMDSLQVPL